MAKYSMKDDFFNPETVKDFADQLKKVYPVFDSQAYQSACISAFGDLELKDRMLYMARLLVDFLPSDFQEAGTILRQVALKLPPDQGFVYGSLSAYVALRGADQERLDHALELLAVLTPIFSAEFAIRTFLNQFPNQTYQAMKTWSESQNPSLRRLASEGLRPKLPWAEKITLDPLMALEILNKLYTDRVRYVTRSVANHMNDLSKIYPDQVLETLKAWQASDKQEPKEMAYIIQHATRTLIKKGNREALDLLGYSSQVKVGLKYLRVLTPKICLGQALTFEYGLDVSEETALMIDYLIDYPKAQGKRSQKVFKLKKVKLKAGETLRASKSHVFKLMTTRRLYPGEYKLSLQVNGSIMGEDSFYLET